MRLGSFIRPERKSPTPFTFRATRLQTTYHGNTLIPTGQNRFSLVRHIWNGCIIFLPTSGLNRATVLMYTQIASKGVRQLVHCLIDGAIHALFSALALSVPGLFLFILMVHRNRGIVPCPLSLHTFWPVRVSYATTEMSINVATFSCSRSTWHIQLHSCMLKHSPGGIHAISRTMFVAS